MYIKCLGVFSLEYVTCIGWYLAAVFLTFGVVLKYLVSIYYRTHSMLALGLLDVLLDNQMTRAL
jgi:hypothetical protein